MNTLPAIDTATEWQAKDRRTRIGKFLTKYPKMQLPTQDSRGPIHLTVDDAYSFCLGYEMGYWRLAKATQAGKLHMGRRYLAHQLREHTGQIRYSTGGTSPTRTTGRWYESGFLAGLAEAVAEFMGE